MKRSILIATTLVVLFQAVAPAPASAHIGWWDWLEELSGPGPFHRRGRGVPVMADWRIACQVDRVRGANVVERHWTSDKLVARTGIEDSSIQGLNAAQRFAYRNLPCSTYRAYGPDDALRVSAFVEVRYGKVSTGEKPVFSDQVEPRGVVTAHALQLNYARQFRGGSIGAGGGVIWFTGDVLTKRPVRLVVTPFTATLRPLEFLTRSPKPYGDLLIARIELVQILGGFEAKDFISPTTSAFSSSSELVPSASISINIAALLRR